MGNCGSKPREVIRKLRMDQDTSCTKDVCYVSQREADKKGKKNTQISAHVPTKPF